LANPKPLYARIFALRQKSEDEEAGISAMKQQACKLWLAGTINTKIRLLEHFQTLNIYELYADSSDAGISATDFAVWRTLA